MVPEGLGLDSTAPTVASRSIHSILGWFLSSAFKIFWMNRPALADSNIVRILGTWQMSVPIFRPRGNLLNALRDAMRLQWVISLVFI